MLAAPLAGCLKEETGIIKNSGSGSSSVTIPGNDEIEAGIFEDLNLEDPALAGVKAHYEGGRYYQRLRPCWSTTEHAWMWTIPRSTC